MLKNIFVIFLFLLISSCDSSESIQSSTDEKICECIYDTYDTIGVDLKLEFSKFENHIIEKGYLKSKSGKSYRDLFIKFKDDYGGSPIKSDFQIAAIDTNLQLHHKCITKYLDNDSKLDSTSKFLKIHNLMFGRNYKSIGEMIDTLITNLNDSDFETEAIKLYSIFIFYLTKENEKVYEEKLPKKNK